MLLVLFGIIIYVFLQLGAFMFVACVAVPTLRSHALSAALWFAALGPSTVGTLLLAGTAIVAQAFTVQNGDVTRFHLPTISKAMWNGYFVFCIVGVIVMSSALAKIHQFLIHRMTYFLFRIYATAVCAGIGSVWAIFVSICLLRFEVHFPLLILAPTAIVLCVAFGCLGFRLARTLRGDAPERFTWLTKDEFSGYTSDEVAPIRSTLPSHH